MKNDWSTFTRLEDNDVVDGWLKIGNEVFIDYCKTKDLKELTQKVLNAAGYTRWIYIIVHDEGDNDGHIGGRLHVKIGECTTDFLNRYGNITGNTYNHRVIEVFPSNVSDKDIHPNLKKNPIKGVRSDEFTRYANGSEEIYEVTNVESLTNLISETHRLAEKTVECVERKEMRLYNDTSDLGDKIVLQCKDFYDKTNGGSPHIICNLCCRFGKTSFALATWLKTNARILMLTSYIGTVTDSYKSIVLKKKGYERVLVVDTTTEEGREAIKKADEWLAKDKLNRVLFLVPLTGTGSDGEVVLVDNTTWKTRTGGLKKFIARQVTKGECFAITCDEVDFGAKRDKQVAKLKNITTIGGQTAIYKMSISGTNAEHGEMIWGKPDITENVGYLDLVKTVYGA